MAYTIMCSNMALAHHDLGVKSDDRVHVGKHICGSMYLC